MVSGTTIWSNSLDISKRIEPGKDDAGNGYPMFMIDKNERDVTKMTTATLTAAQALAHELNMEMLMNQYGVRNNLLVK